MSAVDDRAFSYSENKNGSVFISWYGKPVSILNGKQAVKFLNKMATAKTDEDEQLVMAKITGNFKRGNEKGE